MATQDSPSLPLQLSPREVIPISLSSTKADDNNADSPLADEAGKRRLSLSSYAPSTLSPSASLDLQFPLVMDFYTIREFSITSLRTIRLCGKDAHDLLYTFEARTGYRGRAPLGTRPGIVLHNGTSFNDPVIAAAGDESQNAATPYSLNYNTILYLPALPGSLEERNGLMAKEMMKASTTVDKAIIFRFSTEVANGRKMHRQGFEWEKLPNLGAEENGSGDHKPSARFELFRTFSTADQHQTSRSEQGSLFSSSRPVERESVALMKLVKSKKDKEHIISLELKGDALSGALGDRCLLMIVLTAVRLWWLRAGLRMSRTGIHLSEKIRS